MNLVQFFCNAPVRVSVLNLDPLPKETASGQQYFYSTEDGGFWADVDLHGNIQSLKPDRPFYICKRRTKYGRKRIWDVWLSEPENNTLSVPLFRPSERTERAAVPQPIPIRQETLQPLGTGTDGPVALPLAKRSKTGKIPLDVAVREVISFVTKGLSEAGEQWSDNARQDLVSTVIIAATRAGYTTLWNREDAA